MARGRRSSRRQISLTAASASASVVRSRNSATASTAESGGTAYSRSPVIRRSARLVTQRWRFGQLARTSESAGADARTGSKSSSTSSIRLAPMCSESSCLAPTACSIVVSVSAGSRSAASGTQKIPSAKCSISSAAARSASRVFPIPPGPVSVTRRAPERTSCTTSVSSRRLPTRGAG